MFDLRTELNKVIHQDENCDLGLKWLAENLEYILADAEYDKRDEINVYV